MFRYLFKKIIFLLFSFWIIATITFFLMHQIPGDPFTGEQVIPPEVLRSLYSYYGLDKPLLSQYLHYLSGLFHGNLGVSIIYSERSVGELIKNAFPISARIGLQALCLSVPLGIFFGMIAALKKGKWQDGGAMFVSTIGISIPNFVAASLLQYLLCIKLPLFPLARYGDFSHTVLPTLALSLVPIAYLAKLTRTSMIEVLSQDYIKMAISKGLTQRRVLFRHALPNALLPLISYLGPLTAQILMGSFMVERIFALPGLGGWMIHSIHGRDYPTIMGLTLFFSFLLLSMSFITDLLIRIIDPRTRTSQ